MSNDQIESLSYILAQKYQHVKFSVMQLFFYKFKCGDFGKFYGKVDPMAITCALKDFITECEQKRQEYLNMEYEEKKKAEDEARERRFHFESTWYHCQDDLVKSSADTKEAEVYKRIKYNHYDEEGNKIYLSFSSEDSDLIKTTYIKNFLSKVRQYFPEAAILSKVVSIPQNKPSHPFHDVCSENRKKEIARGIESAKKL